ncbi:MAG: hypothetical protein HC910_19390 [Spirulinaceae cyanobacterium SM2_1_0]|nr:hypothetical protein [Spirulinaceae cyanobacterium SM2_1_0]
MSHKDFRQIHKLDGGHGNAAQMDDIKNRNRESDQQIRRESKSGDHPSNITRLSPLLRDPAANQTRDALAFQNLH